MLAVKRARSKWTHSQITPFSHSRDAVRAILFIFITIQWNLMNPRTEPFIVLYAAYTYVYLTLYSVAMVFILFIYFFYYTRSGLSSDFVLLLLLSLFYVSESNCTRRNDDNA